MTADQCKLVAMRESKAVRRAVLGRLKELEQNGSSTPVITSGTKVVGELAILECFTRLLKPAPSSQMMMLAKIAANNGLESNFLPGYAVDAAPDAIGGSSMPTKAVSVLLKEFDIPLSANAFNQKLSHAGYVKQLSRLNGKREHVFFWSITDKGLAYGKNLTSPSSPRQTQPHWYVDRFLELADLVMEA